jgi:hypothetical protein
MSESESEIETSVDACWWVGDKKTKSYTFTKMQGHNLTFCQMQSPWMHNKMLITTHFLL